MSYRLITTALLASLLAACATENTASHYATGDDAAVVKQGRNRSVAQLSESELRQHRRLITASGTDFQYFFALFQLQ